MYSICGVFSQVAYFCHMVKEVTLENIKAFAKQLISNFSHKIILLKGDLGAGKTTLVKAIFASLGE